MVNNEYIMQLSYLHWFINSQYQTETQDNLWMM
jgi:hypothetical protein